MYMYMHVRTNYTIMYWYKGDVIGERAKRARLFRCCEYTSCIYVICKLIINSYEIDKIK